jgi:uncharacterized protein YggE
MKYAVVMLIGMLMSSMALAQEGPGNDGPPPRPQFPQQRPPLLTVSGRGESSAKPDRAIVRLGAVAQANAAREAQEQVNEIVQKSLDAIKKLGIPEDKITTVGLSLFPVYAQQNPQPNQQWIEPKIIGFRATNTVQVVVDDLTKVGDVIDAGVTAGANNLEGLTFELKNDKDARQAALAQAAGDARSRANVIAKALDVTIDGIESINEGGVIIQPPQPYLARAFEGGGAAMVAGTPVQPGQVNLDATVTVAFRIRQEVQHMP